MERQQTEKRLILEFSGGDFDGRILDSQSPDPIERELTESHRHYFREVGKGCYGVSLSNIERSLRGQPQPNAGLSSGGKTSQYNAEEITETDDAIRVRVKYSVRPAPATNPPKD